MRLEVSDIGTLGMFDPSTIEPSIARHLYPTQGRLLSPPEPVAYKSSALAVRSLNVSSLLSPGGDLGRLRATAGKGNLFTIFVEGGPYAPVEPGRALFGPAVAFMQQRCDDKKEDNASEYHLPRKVAPCQVPPVHLLKPRHWMKFPSETSLKRRKLSRVALSGKRTHHQCRSTQGNDRNNTEQ
ncbi:hypothetical protein F2P79_017820 [Pimephales promelas]|nr:hypothetical protein F2P79_017820 [Pimephales promelas]